MVLTLPVREVLPATPRSRVVRLDLGSHPFPYRPGQAVLIASHGHEKRRAYSLATPPEEAARDRCLELLVGTSAEGTAGPHPSLATIATGALIDVEGPLGRFTFPEAPDTDRFVFIAGGSGIAPLRAMIRTALTVPHERISLLYSARTLNDFAYGPELQQLARDGRIHLTQTVTRETAGEDWSGARGRIGAAELSDIARDPRTLCFICGPPALVHDIPQILQDAGIPRDRIRIEEWG